MKTTLILGLFTGSILAAATGEGAKPAAKDASALSSLPQHDSINIAASGSPNDYCGGFSPAGCSNLCYEWGYACYYCSANYCNCNNGPC